MKVSLNWLKQFVAITAAPRELKAGLTSVGLGAESFAAAGDDFILELEITTNRPDCLSHYGVAREIATLYRKPLKPLRISVQESGARTSNEISIAISNPELCARYCGRVIRNVQVRPSPDWLAKRLEAVGMRSINNVADVTNYVLMELGHPLHAFDLERLRQRKIIVRRAKSGEHLRTLDGIGRLLKPEDLVIADGERAVALAGVMGGEDSEISSATHWVMLESAWFDPLSIRRTAKSQGMHTEASHRFERGADIEMAPLALDRAAQLIAELAGSEVLLGRVDVYPRRRRRAAVSLRSSELLRVLGVVVPPAEVKRILHSLGFEAKVQGKGQWRVVAPSFRLDVTREVDLVEEVARHYGYERLPARLRPALPRLPRLDRREKELAVSSVLVSQGYREIITSSMIDPTENARFTDRPPVALANPLSQEDSVLRSTPIPSMLRALRWNLDRDQVDLRFFEVGKTYSASPRNRDGLPEERWVLTLGLSGHRHLDSVHEHARLVDFFDLKGHLETLFGAFDIRGLRFEPSRCHYYEKESAGRFVDQSGDLAIFGELSREIARQYKFRQALWLAEVDLERLFALPRREYKYRPYSKFPAVERDFSLLVPQGIPYSRLAESVQGLGLEEIRAFRPVERLPEGKIAAGHYSLLLRVNFQSDRRTLTSEEIGQASRRLLEGLKPLGVRLRT